MTWWLKSPHHIRISHALLYQSWLTAIIIYILQCILLSCAHLSRSPNNGHLALYYHPGLFYPEQKKKLDFLRWWCMIVSSEIANRMWYLQARKHFEQMVN